MRLLDLLLLENLKKLKQICHKNREKKDVDFTKFYLLYQDALINGNFDQQQLAYHFGTHW